MQVGYIPEFSRHGLRQTRWHPGEWQPSLWTGAQDYSERNVIPVQTYRCTVCGFLEFYANHQFEPSNGESEHDWSSSDFEPGLD